MIVAFIWIFHTYRPIYTDQEMEKPRMDISFSSTRNSMWSLYEKSGKRAQVALKENIISKSSARMSTISFLDND